MEGEVKGKVTKRKGLPLPRGPHGKSFNSFQILQGALLHGPAQNSI